MPMPPSIRAPHPFRRHPLRAAGVVLAAGLLLSACSSSGGAAKAGGGGGDRVVPADVSSLELSGPAHTDALSAAATDAKAAGAPLGHNPKSGVTIGIVEATTQAGAVIREVNGIKAAASVFGWKVSECDGQGTPATMDQCGNKLVTQKVDVIVSLAVPAPAVETALSEARSAHVPWINSGILVPDPKHEFSGSIAPGVDEEKALYAKLDDWLFGKLGPAGGQIGVFQYSPGVNTAAHADQLNADLKAHPAVTVVSRQEINLTNPIAGTQDAAAAMITQHPKLKAIWNFGDLGLVAIAHGVDEHHLAGSARPLIVGGFPDLAILDAIRKGEVSAAAEFTYEASGWLAVDQIAENLARKSPYVVGLPDYSLDVFTPQVVDATNVVKDPRSFQPPIVDYATYFLAKWHAEFATAGP